MRGWRPARRTGRSGRPSPCPARPGARSAAPGTPRPRNLTAGPALDPGAIPCAAVSERIPFPFIVACGRSGTTMLRVMFEQHPDIAVPPESYFPIRFLPQRDRYQRESGFNLGLLAGDLLQHERFRAWRLDEALVRERLRGVEA